MNKLKLITEYCISNSEDTKNTKNRVIRELIYIKRKFEENGLDFPKFSYEKIGVVRQSQEFDNVLDDSNFYIDVEDLYFITLDVLKIKVIPNFNAFFSNQEMSILKESKDYLNSLSFHELLKETEDM